MLRKDLLLPIDRNFGRTPDYIPNVSPYIRHELNKTSQPERQTEDYAVPYMWGTAGILFNKKFITPEEASTWNILWTPKNRSKILMKDSYRDAYGTAIIYAHARELADSTVTVEQLMNDNSPQAIALAEKYLKEMKPNIAGWEADFGKEMMTKNKAWINFTWSGDAVWAIEEADAVGVELDYTVPREGSNIWYDGWVIPRYARNVKAQAISSTTSASPPWRCATWMPSVTSAPSPHRKSWRRRPTPRLTCIPTSATSSVPCPEPTAYR